MGCCVSKPTTLTTKDPFPDAQNSAEYWAFRKCYGVLADGIYDPGQLAVNLFSTELIERNVRIEAQKPAVEEKVKIGNLLTAVEAQILTSPTTKFTIFLDVLQAEPSLQHLATRLKETYDSRVHSTGKETSCSQEDHLSSPQLGTAVPLIPVVKPLNGESYDNLTEEYTRHRLSGNFSELKNLMSNLKSLRSRTDFEIIALIFNSSYRWLVRQPNQLKDSIVDLEKAVELCKKPDCRNGSQLRAKAYIFLAQNFQSGDVCAFKEAEKYIDAAKCELFYVENCMERGALACQEALLTVAQCHGNMPMHTKDEVKKMLSHAIDHCSRLKSYEGRCFFMYNLINMARLHLHQFYPFSHGRHVQITGVDPQLKVEDLQKAKSYLDQVPKEFLEDSDPSLYKSFYYYTLSEYYRHDIESKVECIANLKHAKKQLQLTHLCPNLLKAINKRLDLLL